MVEFKENSTAHTEDSEISNTSAVEIKCIGWKQEGEHVLFILTASEPLVVSEINGEFYSKQVVLYVRGVECWQCSFNNDIICNETRLFMRDDKIYIKIAKASPEEIWNELSASQIPICEASNKIANEQLLKPVVEPVILRQSDINYDFYETNKNVVVSLYVKDIDQESLVVNFGVQELTVQFCTTCKKFLELHEKCDGESIFKWSTSVFGSLNVDKCSYKVRSSKLELSLSKEIPQLWKRLEPAPSKTRSRDQLPLTKTEHKNIKNSNCETVTFSQTDTKILPNKQEKVAFDMPVAPPLPKKAQKSSTSKGWYADAIQSAKETERPLNESKKPTCKVSPLSKTSAFSTSVELGYTGLHNLGNTCFMNSVIQILINTRVLRDYFLESRFQSDINTENPLGTGGKLAVAFGVLTRILWSGKHKAYAPQKLKLLVAERNSQFTGFAQHDAQEFMAFLLDGLHEDVNRIRKKPYTHTVESDGRPDEDVADESWKTHKLRNDSFVVDNFQAQYRSKLVCPKCSKVSITFDPYMILSVPLPKQKRSFPVVFLSKDPCKKPMHYSVPLVKDATAMQLMEAMYIKTKVHPNNMCVFTTTRNNIDTFYGPNDSIKHVSSFDDIFVNEILSEKLTGEPIIQITVLQRTIMPRNTHTTCSNCQTICTDGMKLKRCSRCYKSAYCGADCQKNHWDSGHKQYCAPSTPELIGSPYIISLPKSQATYSNISRAAENSTKWSVNLFQPPVSSTKRLSQSSSCDESMESVESDENQNCNASNMQDVNECTTTTDQIEHSGLNEPQQTACDNNPLGEFEPMQTDSDSEQNNPRSQFTDGDIPTQYVVGRTTQNLNNASLFYLQLVNEKGRNSGAKLEDKNDEPLKLASKFNLAVDWKTDEKLTPYCIVTNKSLDCDYQADENLNSKYDDVTLQQCLSKFTEPEILSPEHTWYCPQCKEHCQASKQLTLWTLPNILCIQLKRFRFRNLLWRDKIDRTVQFPIRGLDMSSFLGSRVTDEGAIYDLYGVINHHGGILGGHYTAYGACVKDDGRPGYEVGWRLFDDSHVSTVSERQVMTQDAYVLFYQKRLPINLCAEITPVKDPLTTESIESDLAKPEQDKNIPLVVSESFDQNTKETMEVEPMTSSTTIPTVVKNSLDDSDLLDRSINNDSSISESYTDMDSID